MIELPVGMSHCNVCEEDVREAQAAFVRGDTLPHTQSVLIDAVLSEFCQRHFHGKESVRPAHPAEQPEPEQDAWTTSEGVTCHRDDCQRILDLESGHRCAACDGVFCENHISPGTHCCTAEGKSAETEVARRMRESLRNTDVGGRTACP